MHFCCLVITEEFPTDEVIGEVLHQYDDSEWADNDDDELPVLMCDWWQVGGRYNGLLKLKVDNEDEKYNWEFYAKEKRNGRLFRSYALDKIKEYSPFYYEEDYFLSMGMRDGFLYVDGGLIDDMKSIDVEGYYLIDRNGILYCRETSPDYSEIVRQTIRESTGCYICVVDVHE